MSRHISNVVDIQIKPKKSWTVLVQVLETGHLQESQSGNQFKRFVLVDSQGTRLTALIYNDDIRFFAKLLTQYKRYYISNAVVINNQAKYRLSLYPYSWILTNKTLVEEYVETIPVLLGCEFEFTKFSDLHKYADTESLQNVRAIVLQCFPSKEQGSVVTTTRDVVIVNEKKKLMLLTLWTQFDEKEGTALANMIESGPPMIFGLRLRVSTFNGLSLTTRASSGFMINPPVPDDLQMQEWYNKNKHELQELLEMKSYKNTDMLLPYPKDEDIISVTTANSALKTLKTCWVKGKTSFPRQEKSLWFTACGNCQKALDADLTWVVTCPSCRIESDVQAISRITIQIDDGNASIWATICSPDAEKLMPFTAIELKQAEEYGIDRHDDIAKSVNQHTIVAFIRTYETTLHGKSEMKMNVVKAYTLDEVIQLPSIISRPSKEFVSESTMNVATPAAIKLPTKEQVSKSTKDTSIPTTGKEKEQLFTPSTKLILEEISSTISSKTVKRSLPFSNEDLGKETIATINKPQTTFVPLNKKAGSSVSTLVAIKKEIGAQMADGSPTKKTKDR